MHALLGALLLAPSTVPYRWKNVQMVGAGFVDGIVFSPSIKGVRYARTDIGGAYRWDAGTSRWVPMLDWVPYPDLNLMGVESIAVDPHDAKRVYLACGTYTDPSTPDGAILRSSDGGRTFATARVPIKFGGNENGRGSGERMGVDPFDANHLLLGTRHDGLWESLDGAASWRRATAFGATTGPREAGVVVTLFDPAAQGTAYVAVSTLNGPTLYRTTDGGKAWTPVEGGPKGLVPNHLLRAQDGTLWLSYGSSAGPSGMTDGAVWTLKDGAWADVSPEKGRFGYGAVSVSRGAAIASTFNHAGGEQLFRTTDGGRTWRKTIGGKETYDYSKAPYIARTGIHWLLDIEIDPFDKDHAIFTTGYGGHETFDLTNADRGRPVHWRAMATGIEESVGLRLLSPTRGVPLVTAIGDYGGFVHRDLDRPVPEGNFTTPHFGNTTDVAAGDFAPETMVRVGVASGGSRQGNLGFSLDGGATWRPAPATPSNAREGRITVSSDGRTWIWSLRGGTYRTDDYGFVWTPCEGLPTGLNVVADRVSPARFYALDLFGDRLYLSEDGGRRFRERPLALPGGSPKPGGRGDDRGRPGRALPHARALGRPLAGGL